MSCCSRPRSRSEAPRRAACLLPALLALAGGVAHAGSERESTAFAVIASPLVPVADVALPDLARLLMGERRFLVSGLGPGVLPRAGPPPRAPARPRGGEPRLWAPGLPGVPPPPPPAPPGPQKGGRPGPCRR